MLPGKVRLKFHSIGEIVGSDELGIITLVDEPQERMLTIVCDKAMAVQLELRAKQIPITKVMLPEVLAQVMKRQGGIRLEVLIKELIDGQYIAKFLNPDTYDTIPVRAADAVLFSLAADAPIYIEPELMQRQSVRFAEGTRGISIPVNSLSTDIETTPSGSAESRTWHLDTSLSAQRRSHLCDRPTEYSDPGLKSTDCPFRDPDVNVIFVISGFLPVRLRTREGEWAFR